MASPYGCPAAAPPDRSPVWNGDPIYPNSLANYTPTFTNCSGLGIAPGVDTFGGSWIYGTMTDYNIRVSRRFRAIDSRSIIFSEANYRLSSYWSIAFASPLYSDFTSLNPTGGLTYAWYAPAYNNHLDSANFLFAGSHVKNLRYRGQSLVYSAYDAGGFQLSWIPKF